MAKFSRRSFLKAASVAAVIGSAVYALTRADPLLDVFSDKEVIEGGETRVYNGACAPDCWSGCRLHLHVRDGKLVKVAPAPYPDPQYNRVCLRGLSNVQRVYNPLRLRHPMKRVGERGEGEWMQVSWDEAIDEIAQEFTRIRDEYGPSAVAMVASAGYYGRINGYYGANVRFADVFGGTYASGANDIAMPLGIFQVVGGPAFGQGNEAADLANAKLIIAWGANITEANIHNWHFVADSLDNGGKLVVIDPIFTITASKAHEWVPVRPGTDTALALSMMNVMIREELYNEDFVLEHTVGPFLVRTDNGQFLREKDLFGNENESHVIWDLNTNEARPFYWGDLRPTLRGEYHVGEFTVKPAFQLLWELVDQYPPEVASGTTGVPPEQIESVARDYATIEPATIYPGFGLDRYHHGDLAGHAIATLAALTGNIGKPGATPWGGFGAAALVTWKLNIWQFTHPAQRVSPLNMLLFFDAVSEGVPYPIKAAFITNSGFLTTYPNKNKILNDVLPNLDLVVVADFVMTDTAKYADIVLPVTSWFEREDIVPGQHPFLMMQEKAIEPLYESKTDLEVFSLLAQRLGLGEYFNKSAREFMEELFDRQDLRDSGITLERLREEGTFRYTEYPHVPYQDLNFGTPSGRLEFYKEWLNVNVHYGQEIPHSEQRLPVFKPPVEAWHENPLHENYPLVLIQAASRFRVHTQWTNFPWLLELNPEPTVDLSPRDAEDRDIVTGDTVRVFNDRGEVVLKALVNPAISPGAVNLAKGAMEDQYVRGDLLELLHDQRNPVTMNCSYFDVLVEVEKEA